MKILSKSNIELFLSIIKGKLSEKADNSDVLLKENNLSDVADRQTSLNTLVNAGTDNQGKILYIDSSNNVSLTNRFETAGGIQTNELSTHDCRYDRATDVDLYQPIMKFYLSNGQEKMGLEFEIQSCDYLGYDNAGPLYCSRYIFQHSKITSDVYNNFMCVYSTDKTKYKDVIALYDENNLYVTFYKKRNKIYDYFINIVYSMSTNAYFNNNITFYIGSKTTNVKDFEVRLTDSDFLTELPTDVTRIDPEFYCQSDWNETDTTSTEYIKNKPDIPEVMTEEELTEILNKY